MRRFLRNNDEPGHDSFLDIVANLVGILIILVMVIGVRAKGAWVESATNQDEENPADMVDVESSRREFNNIDTHVRQVESQLDGLEATNQARQKERDHLNLMVQAAEMQLDERRTELDDSKKEALDIKSKFRLVSANIERLRNKKRALETAVDAPIELEHLPTPIAKTVFGNEEHFRLLDGKLVYVPLNELTEKLRDEAPKKLWKLQRSSRITETIGPIQGFHMQYTMQRRSVAQNTKNGPVVRQMAELEKFILLPMGDDLGEPIQAALAAGSQFRQVLATLKPKSTVVTVWTYPNSFGDFRVLKSWLFDRGYVSAARPLPFDQPISGSPEGSRSSAQ